MESTTLPVGVRLKTYQEDLVVEGPGLDAAQYQKILGGLPEAIKGRVIGWKRTSR